MKTTLVKEKIRQAVIDYKIEELRLNSQPSGSLISQHEQALETATQAIQKLVDEECIKARIERDNNARYVLHSILSDDVDSELDHSDIEALFEVRLTTTESPLKPVKEDI